MGKPRRENNSNRTVQFNTDGGALEALGRMVTPAYDPNAESRIGKQRVWTDGADVRAYTPGKDEKTPGKWWKNNVRKRERWEKGN